MDISRKIGIGIVMIVPSFVGSGALWGICKSWLAILVWIAIMIILYGGIITGKLSRN